MSRPVKRADVVKAILEPHDPAVGPVLDALRERAANVQREREERHAAEADAPADDGRTRVLTADEAARVGGSASWGAKARYERGEKLERQVSGGVTHHVWLDAQNRVLG